MRRTIDTVMAGLVGSVPGATQHGRSAPGNDAVRAVPDQRRTTRPVLDGHTPDVNALALRRIRDTGSRIFIMTVLMALCAAEAAAGADVEKGKALYAACLVCHSEKPDALGPSLRGVVGRRSAALEDFHYSNPMKRANLTWDEANLRAYIADPQGKVKGNRMPFGGVPNQSDIDDILAFLKTYK